MGPAIRHATYKLKLTDAKVKILFLLSDGRPQDHGYGRDRTEKEYAIHDTKQALNEAKREGITPFALTVDRAGHDYLKTMCEDMGYEVVADIEALPSRLPTPLPPAHGVAECTLCSSATENPRAMLPASSRAASTTA